MEVQFSSFSITQVLPMIKMKTKGPKNKKIKPQGCLRYLTLLVLHFSSSWCLIFQLKSCSFDLIRIWKCGLNKGRYYSLISPRMLHFKRPNSTELNTWGARNQPLKTTLLRNSITLLKLSLSLLYF
jgi:hypothetical protein